MVSGRSLKRKADLTGLRNKDIQGGLEASERSRLAQAVWPAWERSSRRQVRRLRGSTVGLVSVQVGSEGFCEV